MCQEESGLPPPSRLVAKELPAMANVSLSWRRGGGKHGELPRSSMTATQRKSKEIVPVAALGHAPCCTVGYWAHNHQVRWLTTIDGHGQSRGVDAILNRFVPCIDQGRPDSRDNHNGIPSQTAAARQPSGASSASDRAPCAAGAEPPEPRNGQRRRLDWLSSSHAGRVPGSAGHPSRGQGVSKRAPAASP